MNSAIFQRTQVKNTWKKVYTEEYLIDAGPIHLESAVIQMLCVKHIFLSNHKEKNLISKLTVQIEVLERYLTYKNWPSIIGLFWRSVLLIDVLLFQLNCHHMLGDYYLWVIRMLLKDKTM